ncbi:hypothetical protein JOE11_003718 [Robbsia andropogonis]|uniref:N-acetylmuramidase domain-containing protein n=1 Tax=Robbsia andropogonis TaxID=28092 RepID=UPI003D208B58
MTQRLGDQGGAVALLQQRLRRADFDTPITHVFDDATEDAVKALQERAGLVVDGIVGLKTEQVLRTAQPAKRDLRDADLHQAAQTLDVPIAAVRAVNEVESRGNGFFADGRPVMLFERHVFWRRLEARAIAPTVYASDYPNVLARTPGGYQGGPAEYTRLGSAALIDPDAAHESASWGAFQVMGFHWERLGYASIEAFLTEMWRSESAHLDAFVRFIKADPTLHAALRGKKWTAFAKSYNGPAYARNLYDVRLARAYDRYADQGKTATARTSEAAA